MAARQSRAQPEGTILRVEHVIGVLTASRRLWGLVSARFGWSLLPVGYRVRGQISEGGARRGG